ncbi:hypothetical protein [Paenibacillus sp. HB172176]|uniref:hypothetical protein n=1 Tax=Paenibacillus sp. HB172176 TaxID=2493690 RepID=UPI00143AF9E1|nr:hypothetical protein [Paenibacillus sp. HB172176]
MKKPIRMAILSFAGATLLYGCGDYDGQVEQMRNMQIMNAEHAKAVKNPSLIPSQDGMKTYTTNEKGHTTYGLGSSVYSLIGSSSLHAAGFSAHLESRLSGDGVPNVRVFVFDDSVVLATEKLEPSATQYDEAQQRLLGSDSGLAANGSSADSGKLRKQDAGNANLDNLAMAAQLIEGYMGGAVKVMKVEDAEAVKLIEAIRMEAAADEMNAAEIANDIGQLLQIVKERGGQ